MSRFGRRSLAASHSWEGPRPAHVGRESWDVDDRRTDEQTVDKSDSSEDERDCTPRTEFVSHVTSLLLVRS